MEDINEFYFNTLLEKSKNTAQSPLVLRQPEKDVDSNVVPLAIANDEDLQSIQIKSYDDLSENFCEELKKFTYCLVKMQAGLGTSVQRSDLIKEVEDRQTLGAKGTDLYFKVNGQLTPIAEIQLRQAICLSQQKYFEKIKYIDLVNDETQTAVEAIWNKKFGAQSYKDFFMSSDHLSSPDMYFQKKMQTLNSENELTDERLAPAGHGFIGFKEILDIFESDLKHEVVAIGNGEDLSSTPDLKIINWVVENNIPITMITTTKTQADKKGGQISIIKGQPDLVTIVEKAQAETAGQLEYFEQLGLRKSDKISLFNTNIVVINKKALKERFNEYLKDFTVEKLAKSFAPDVIKNLKEQDGKTFTQLESALGSVVLNLDKFFRNEFQTSLVSFLNLPEKQRELFFMPIKKREDYDKIFNEFKVDEKSFRLVKK